MNDPFVRVWVCLVGLTGLLIGCGGPAATPTDTPRLAPTATASLTATAERVAIRPSPSPTTIMTAIATATPSVPATAAVTATPTPTATPTATPTPTPRPTFTPIPSFTPAPRQPTPAPPAQCPPAGSPTTFTVQDLFPLPQEPILAYLNRRGSAAGLQALLEGLTVETDPPAPVLAHVLESDLTGDGVSEVVVDVVVPEGGGYASAALLVFSCREGAYQPVLAWRLSPGEGLYPDGGYGVRATQDMNGDGVRDLVVALTAGPTRRFYILEWNGRDFGSLVEPRFDPFSTSLVYYIEVQPGDGEAVDRDGDGLYEWVVTHYSVSPPPDSKGEAQPVRRDVWAWDGYAFRLQSSEILDSQPSATPKITPTPLKHPPTPTPMRARR